MKRRRFFALAGNGKGLVVAGEIEDVTTDEFIRRIEVGRAYCSLCNRNFNDSRIGRNSHRVSASHKRLLEERQRHVGAV